jgi:hypothetical protein
MALCETEKNESTVSVSSISGLNVCYANRDEGGKQSLSFSLPAGFLCCVTDQHYK